MRCAVLACLLAVASCTRPSPPTIVPERVRITGLTPTQVDVEVTLNVANPNTLDLVARSLEAHVVIADKFDVGTVEIPVTTVFPAGKTTRLDVPLTVQIRDIAPLAQLALASPSIPYTVDGSVGLGGELLHVAVPYRLSDSVPREQIVRAAFAAVRTLH